MRNLPDQRAFNLIRLVVVVPLSAGLYILSARILRIEMLSLLTGKKK
jgi:hypothetical protein